MDASRYFFSDPDQAIARQVIFISGVARSGTTLLGKLVGSLSAVEYEFEPLLLTHLPALEAVGLLNEDTAASLLQGAFDECLYERMLGRGVNLRPADDSRFWLTKPYDELMRRWRQSLTRNEMKREVEAHRLWLAVKAPDLAPYYGFLLRRFERSILLNIQRNGVDVVRSTLQKGWYHDNFLEAGIGRVPSRKSSDGRVVPAWVEPEMQEQFLAWSEATRSLYKWRHLVEEAERQMASSGASASRIVNVEYEELIQDPRKVLSEITAVIESAKCTLETEQILQKIDASRARQRSLERHSFDPEEFDRAAHLLIRLGYTSDE